MTNGFSFDVSSLRLQEQVAPEVRLHRWARTRPPQPARLRGWRARACPAGGRIGRKSGRPAPGGRYAVAMTHDRPAPSILVVFCRRPARGVGKQRIAAAVGAGPALGLAEHLLAAALEDAAHWPGPVVLSPAAPADREWAASLLGRTATVVPQTGGNLGARINDVDRQLRGAGSVRLFYVGADAPLLDHAYYARARIALDHADVVLGPAEDGGVTLMGARVPWPDIADLPWSTADLGEALDRHCRAQGLGVARLATQYDVDEAQLLPRLHRDLAHDARPARRALREWLQANGLQAETDVVIGPA